MIICSIFLIFWTVSHESSVSISRNTILHSTTKLLTILWWTPPLQGSDWMVIANLILKKEAIINYNSVWAIMKKELATHSSTLALKIPWMEEPGRLQSMGSQRVRHNQEISLPFFSFGPLLILIMILLILLGRNHSLGQSIMLALTLAINNTFSLNVTQVQSKQQAKFQSKQ